MAGNFLFREKIKDILWKFNVKNEEEKMEVWARKWIENSKLRVKESSYVKYYNIVEKHIIPSLGNLEIKEITTDRVLVFIAEKLKNGKLKGGGGLSEKSVKDIVTVLKEICSFISDCGGAVPCRMDLIKIKLPKSSIHILNRKEQFSLERLLLSNEDLIKTGILLSLHMGLRLGEVCALKRKHIIMERKVLQIRCTMQRLQNIETDSSNKTKIIITEPKSEASVRDIPIPEFLMERLKVLENIPSQAYILTGETEHYIEPRTLENIFKNYLKQCQIKDINYHALRHTFATRCIEIGFDTKTLSEILGHTNVNITLNRYVHSSMEQKRKNMNKINIQQEKEVLY